MVALGNLGHGGHKPKRKVVMGLFNKAVKHDAKLRLAISGPSGSGKTFTALTIATAMNTGKRIALVDTEHGSASKYADLFDFDVAEMHPPFHPDKFATAIREAAQAGYGVIILDSLTHAWNGEGGMLELVTEIAKRKYSGNTYVAWNDATPIQKALIESIIGAQIHVIATMRSKMDYVVEKDEKTGKSSPKKIGMAPEQRSDMPYEFDVMFDMNVDNEAIVSKTRCSALAGRVISKPGKNVADVLVKWLQAEPAAQTPQPTISQTHTTPATNGNGSNGHKPTPVPVPSVESLADVSEAEHGGDVVATEDEVTELLSQARQRFHGCGTSTFGPTWDDVRHAISNAMQVESSSQFTAPQLNALADSFKAKSRQWQTWQRAMSKGTLPPVELAFGSPVTN